MHLLNHPFLSHVSPAFLHPVSIIYWNYTAGKETNVSKERRRWRGRREKKDGRRKWRENTINSYRTATKAFIMHYAGKFQYKEAGVICYYTKKERLTSCKLLTGCLECAFQLKSDAAGWDASWMLMRQFCSNFHLENMVFEKNKTFSPEGLVFKSNLPLSSWMLMQVNSMEIMSRRPTSLLQSYQVASRFRIAVPPKFLTDLTIAKFKICTVIDL